MHAFIDEVWRQSQDALINAIVSDTERSVYTLRVELLARSRHPKILGRVSLAIEQRVESEKLQLAWRSSLTAPTESEKDEEVRAEGTPDQMIDAFQKALAVEVARWLTHLPFNENPGSEAVTVVKPASESPKMNVGSLEIKAALYSLAAMPFLPEMRVECREGISILLLGECPMESEKRQLADFRRGVLALVERAVKRSQEITDRAQSRLPLHVTLKCGNSELGTCFEFTLAVGPTLAVPERWRLRRFTPGEDLSEIGAFAEIEPLLEAMAELLEQKTSDWFSHLVFRGNQSS